LSSFLSNPLVAKKLSKHFGVSEESILGAKNLGVESFKQIFELGIFVKIESWLNDLEGLSEPEDKKKLISHESYKEFSYLYQKITQLNKGQKTHADDSFDAQELSQYFATKGDLYKLIINHNAYNYLEYSYHGPFGHGIGVDTTNEIYEIVDFMTTDLVAAYKIYEDGFYTTEFNEEEYFYWERLFDIFNPEEN
jgi:hypothetical protein